MRRWTYLSVVLLLGLLLGISGGALAADKSEANKPARKILAAFEYPGVTVAQGDQLRVGLSLLNLGRSNETLLFKNFKAPAGWEADLKHRGKIVSGIFLPEDKSLAVDLVAKPAEKKEIKPGRYQFSVEVVSSDGALKQSAAMAVTVTGKEKSPQGLSITTSYPVLRGPTDSKFEFSINVRNKTDQDGLFSLSAQAPKDWEVSFKPGYEQKQISSLQIKAGQSQTVKVAINPSRAAAAGNHPLVVKVASDFAAADIKLTVQLTGTYKIKAGTRNGVLSLAAQTSKPSTLSFYVRNDGSAPQSQVNLLSFQPENWKVEFKPDKLLNLKPGEMKQVEVSITPADQALVGDYSVAINARGQKANSNLELRVTVKASSAWGWIGMIIILLVLAGLGFVFRKLGRR